MKVKRIVNKKLLKELKGTPCVICGQAGEAHHIKTVKSGGNDELQNLMVLCRQHHTEWHARGTSSFLDDKKNIKALEWMIENDWFYDSFFNKWRKIGTKGIIDDD